MRLKKVIRALNIIKVGLGWSLLVISGSVNAHGRWMIPSHTILSGDEAETISLDISISNEIFNPDIAYGGIKIGSIGGKATDSEAGGKAITDVQQLRKRIMAEQFGSTKLSVVNPDGSVAENLPLVDVVRKSVSAYALQQEGTYRFSIRQKPVELTLYQTADGKKHREFGRYEKIKSVLPKDSKNIKQVNVINTVETYVTRNNISEKALLPQNGGLEVLAISHPNELFEGEKSRFKLLLNGQPLPKHELAIIRHNTRYRNNRDVQTVVTDKEGAFEVIWSQAGMVLIESETTQMSKDSPAVINKYATYLTLEISTE